MSTMAIMFVTVCAGRAHYCQHLCSKVEKDGALKSLKKRGAEDGSGFI